MIKKNQETLLKKNLFKIKFLSAYFYEDKFYKQFFRVTFCEWDDTPYLSTVTILGLTFEFEIGKNWGEMTVIKPEEFR